jgi:hypothetical protein
MVGLSDFILSEIVNLESDHQGRRTQPWQRERFEIIPRVLFVRFYKHMQVTECILCILLTYLQSMSICVTAQVQPSIQKVRRLVIIGDSLPKCRLGLEW